MNKWYIGQIKDANSEDNTVEVSFLETKKAMFQWPARPDVIWIDISNVLCKVSDPKPSGKSECMLVMNPNDIKKYWGNIWQTLKSLIYFEMYVISTRYMVVLTNNNNNIIIMKNMIWI